MRKSEMEHGKWLAVHAEIVVRVFGTDQHDCALFQVHIALVDKMMGTTVEQNKRCYLF